MGILGYSYVTSTLFIELKNISYIFDNGEWKPYHNYGGHNRIFLNKNYDLVIRQDIPADIEKNFNLNDLKSHSYHGSFDIERFIFNKLLEKHGKEFFINNPKFDIKVYSSEEQQRNNEYTDIMDKLNAYNLIFYIKNKNTENEVFPYILDFSTYKLVRWHDHVTTRELFNYAFTDCPYSDNGILRSYKELSLTSDKSYKYDYSCGIDDVLSFNHEPVLMSMILQQIIKNNDIHMSDIYEISKISYIKKKYTDILKFIGVRNADVKKGAEYIYPETGYGYSYDKVEERIFLNYTFGKYLDGQIYCDTVDKWLQHSPLENVLKLCDYYIDYCTTYVCGTPIKLYIDEDDTYHDNQELNKEIASSRKYKKLKCSNPESELLKFWDEQYQTFKNAFDLIDYKELKISFNKYYRLYKTLTSPKTINKYILRKMLIEKIKEDTANGVDVIVKYQITKKNLAEILVEV